MHPFKVTPHILNCADLNNFKDQMIGVIITLNKLKAKDL